MSRYSLFGLLRNAASGHERWPRVWRRPTPRERYDVVIIGGGGHGLATAYYLANEHGVTNVAVLEKGWLGCGNVARNTAIIRSNYLWNESAGLYDASLGMWEGLSQELNFNLMFSQRGVLDLVHDHLELYNLSRRVSALRLNGVDVELLTVAQIKARVPILDAGPGVRYPIVGAGYQRRGGIARHDAVAWAYARAADARGVDIVQNCEVTGFRRTGGRVAGVETTRGFIGAGKVGVAVAGHSSVLAEMIGLRLPVTSHPLQALVSEPIKPVLHTVVTSTKPHVYVNQSDKGELVVGAATDAYFSYAQRGSPGVIEEMLAGCIELFPAFSRLRMMRQWAGTVDVCPDDSPIVTKTPIEGLYFNCGWGTGGFKATPVSGWTFAYLIARDRPHPLIEPFGLARFAAGRLINEHAAAGVAH